MFNILLRFKSDVTFWRSTKPEVLNKYLSVRSILGGTIPFIIMFFLSLSFFLRSESSSVKAFVHAPQSLAQSPWRLAVGKSQSGVDI